MSRRPWTDHIDRAATSDHKLLYLDITRPVRSNVPKQRLCRVGRGLTTLTGCNIGSQAAISVRDPLYTHYGRNHIFTTIDNVTRDITRPTCKKKVMSRRRGLTN
ncbi:hypothetical protein J6590_087779 [Homalodisca vitripennis]|nr:hypothetical protein J6590_087779 [Homalodisca vitripennis]